jgi:hypothetical protein
MKLRIQAESKGKLNGFTYYAANIIQALYEFVQACDYLKIGDDG